MNQLVASILGLLCAVGLAAAPSAPAAAGTVSVTGEGWAATVTVPDLVWTGVRCQELAITIHIVGALDDWVTPTWELRAGAWPKRTGVTTMVSFANGHKSGDFTVKGFRVCPIKAHIGLMGVSAALSVRTTPGQTWGEEKVFNTDFVVPAPTPVVKVKAVGEGSRLRVNVNPNKGRRYWTFQVQAEQPDGSWAALRTYRTKRSTETRTVDLPAGQYRVWVNAKFGFTGVQSAEVTLTG